MLKKINRCDIYVGLWCLYTLQGIIYPVGIINQLLQLLMLLWGLFALYRYIFSVNTGSKILKATFLLVVMYVIYGCINILIGGNGHRILGIGSYVYLQSSLNSLSPIFLFYIFSQKGFLTSDRLRIYLPIFILVSILVFYRIETISLLKSNKEEITNNIGYMFVSLIPLLFFYDKRPIFQYFLMVLVLLFIMSGMKRGAIILGTCGIIILLYNNLVNSKGWSKFFVISLSVLFVLLAARYVNEKMSNSEYFAKRIEQTLDGNSSGRDLIYSKIWNTIIEEHNIFYFLFGRGANSTVDLTGALAHQDWLETLCNNGVVGGGVLFFFFYVLAKSLWIYRKRIPKIMYFSFLTLFLMILGKTIFSMSIQNLDLAQSMLLGYFASYMSNISKSKFNFEYI